MYILETMRRASFAAAELIAKRSVFRRVTNLWSK